MESTVAQRPLNICMVASEVVPLAKTGGLADVVGALAVECASLGHDVAVVLPAYRQVDALGYEMADLCTLSIPTKNLALDIRIQQVFVPTLRVAGPGRLRVFVVRHDPFFSRPGLYQEAGRDYPDNLDRFVLFCRSVMELLLHLHATEQWRTDLLHLHDWQAALCAVYLRTLYHTRPSLSRTRSVLTIHNLGYQGLFPAEEFPATGLSGNVFTPAALEFYGRVNVLKGGLVFADRLTTVSPTYSQEIQTAEYGCGLEGVISERKSVLSGIVNGIDANLWNPTNDQYLPAPYTASDLSGKARCKQALQREVGLRSLKGPLLAVIARLTSQKGIDLVIDILPELMALNVQMVILGTGDPVYERQVRELGERYAGRVAVRNVFDEGLAHRIEAGADMFLMPSRYEPCGLNQMYSLKYGTLPIVRATGGLDDTVQQYDEASGAGTGFKFWEPSSSAIYFTVGWAVSTYYDRPQHIQQMVQAAMAQDYSWEKSAAEYVRMYERALQVRG